MQVKYFVSLLSIYVGLYFVSCNDSGTSLNDECNMSASSSSNGDVYYSATVSSSISSSSDSGPKSMDNLSSSSTPLSNSMGSNSVTSSSSSITYVFMSSFSNVESSSSMAERDSSIEINYADFTDPRDEHTYTTVLIGSQIWMAQNLNYDTLNGSGSYCYSKTTTYCDTYGRLYNWATTMKVASTYNSAILGDSIEHQGICPSGWHIPRNSEWQDLINFVGGKNVAGGYLKAISGWKSYMDVENSDLYGFSALPGGVYYNSAFNSVKEYGYWWSSTEYSNPLATYSEYEEDKKKYAAYRIMGYTASSIVTISNDKTHYFSVRCLKNSE